MAAEPVAPGPPGPPEAPRPPETPRPPEVLPPFADDRTFLERKGITPPAFAALCILFFFVVYQVLGSLASALIFGLSPDLTEPGGFRAFTGISQVLLLLLPTLLLARLASPRPLEFLRVRAPSAPAVLAAVIGVFSLQSLLQVYMVFQGMIPLPPELEKMITQMKEALDQALMSLIGAGSLTEFAAVATVIAVIPAIAEEFLFRGLIQRSFERGLGPVRAFIVTGVIFGGFHLNPFQIVPLVALGVYLGFLAWRGDSIWVSSSAHFFNNMIPVSALYFGLGGEEVASGDLGDLPAGLLIALFWFSGVIFLLSTYYFLHVTRQKGAPPAEDREADHP